MLPALVDLLILTKPLIDQLSPGKKKVALQRAWINTMNNEAAGMLDLDTGRLPNTTEGAARELLRLVPQLGKAAGMDGIALQAFFSELADQGVMSPVDPEQLIRRIYALLGVLQAQQIAAALPADSADEEQGPNAIGGQKSCA
jgi:hypothetical protein